MKNKDGKYAEIINEIAEHVYHDNIKKTERRAKVKFSDGNYREIDLLVTLNNGEQIVFEVRDRRGNQKVDWIDQVIGKYTGMPFSKVWVCTFGDCYLTKDAIRKLNYYNIGWRNIDINNDDSLSENPVLIIDAVKAMDDDSEMIINGQKYRELVVKCINPKGELIDISLREQILNQVKLTVESNFDFYLEKNNIEYEIDVDLGSIPSNFDSNVVKIKINLPLVHYTLYDYFSDNYIVSDNNKQDYLLATKNKSVFITDKYIVLNFSYLSNLKSEGYIISNHYLLFLESIPEKYKGKCKLRIIDVDGNSNAKLMKVMGYKNK